MNSLDCFFRVGISATCKGVPANPRLMDKISQVFGPHLVSKDGQCYIGSVEIPADNNVYTISLLSGLDNPLGEEITGTEAFRKVYGVAIIHLADSGANRVVCFANDGNAFRGQYEDTSGGVTIKRGAYNSFGAMDSTDGYPVAGELTGGTGTETPDGDGWELNFRVPFGVTESASLAVWVFGTK